MSDNFGYGLLAGSGVTTSTASERDAVVAASMALIKKAELVAQENRTKESIFSGLLGEGKIGAATHTHFEGGDAWIYEGSIYWIDADGINAASADFDYYLTEKKGGRYDY